MVVLLNVGLREIERYEMGKEQEVHVEQRDEREYAQDDLVRARVGLLSARFVRARDLIAATEHDRDGDGSVDAHVEQDHARRVREKDHHERVNLARVFVEQTQVDIEIYL